MVDKALFDGEPYHTGACYEVAKLRVENEQLKLALKEIAKGEGAFSLDPLTHASNTIDNMKEIAEKALEEI